MFVALSDSEMGQLFAACALFERIARQTSQYASNVEWKMFSSAKLIAAEDAQILEGIQKHESERTSFAALAAICRGLCGFMNDEPLLVLLEYARFFFEDEASYKRMKQFQRENGGNPDASLQASLVRLLGHASVAVGGACVRLLLFDADFAMLHPWDGLLVWSRSHMQAGEDVAVCEAALLAASFVLPAMLQRNENADTLAFEVARDAIALLPAVSSVHVGDFAYQTAYNALLVVWLACADRETVVERAVSEGRIVEHVAACLSANVRPKVVRMALMVLQRVLTCDAAVWCDVVQRISLRATIATLQQRSTKDADVCETLLPFAMQRIDAVASSASSFEAYVRRLVPDALAWTPIHSDAAFWRANWRLLERDDCRLLRALLHVLFASVRSESICVALSDIYQYLAHCGQEAAGRLLLSTCSGTKQRIFSFINHPDADVRFHALLAAQKLLWHPLDA